MCAIKRLWKMEKSVKSGKVTKALGEKSGGYFNSLRLKNVSVYWEAEFRHDWMFFLTRVDRDGNSHQSLLAWGSSLTHCESTVKTMSELRCWGVLGVIGLHITPTRGQTHTHTVHTNAHASQVSLCCEQLFCFVNRLLAGRVIHVCLLLWLFVFVQISG